MKREKLVLSIAGCFVIGVCASQQKPETRPNIIYIITDQQSETMMSCTGNKNLKTPAMDYIATNGIRFTRAYTTNPVCSPARVSMMTGRFPGYFNSNIGDQARENVGSLHIPEVSEVVKSTTIAAFLKKAGYELVFGGKEHLPSSLTPEALGFKKISNDTRDILPVEASNFIKEKHDKPYYMVVSLINPHDICQMAIQEYAKKNPTQKGEKKDNVAIATLEKAMQLPAGISREQFFAAYCPPLPPNFEPQIDEPLAIGSYLDGRAFLRSARENFTEEQWRMHRWAYARLTEVVDAQIQVVLDALKESGQEENTLVLFSSDHGDMDASHRMEHKTVLYEESANIPFMAMWKGHLPSGKVDSEHLVSNGLDLLPTVCDFAGINAVADPRGRSLRPLMDGTETTWRETLGVESEIGRMVVSKDGYKYIRYDAVGVEERLMDLNKDPLEKSHVTALNSYTKILSNLRKAFNEEWFPGF